MGSVLERIIHTREAVMKDGTQRGISRARRNDGEKESRGKATLPPLFPPLLFRPFLGHQTVAVGGLNQAGLETRGASQTLYPPPMCFCDQLQMSRPSFSTTRSSSSPGSARSGRPTDVATATTSVSISPGREKNVLMERNHRDVKALSPPPAAP